jgi:hypothetical protein
MSSFPQSDWIQYQTGETVEVLWNASDATTFTCNGVTVGGQNCTSCSICDFKFIPSDGTSATVIESLTISSDCTNVPDGRNAVCEDYTPLFYPLNVSEPPRCVWRVSAIRTRLLTHIDLFSLSPIGVKDIGVGI